MQHQKCNLHIIVTAAISEMLRGDVGLPPVTHIKHKQNKRLQQSPGKETKATKGSHIDDKARLRLRHVLCDVRAGNVMRSQTDVIDDVPHLDSS